MEDSIKKLDSNEALTLNQVALVVNGYSEDDPLLVSVLVTSDGDEYYTTDWQCCQPENLEQCERYDWLSADDLDIAQERSYYVCPMTFEQVMDIAEMQLW